MARSVISADQCLYRLFGRNLANSDPHLQNAPPNFLQSTRKLHTKPTPPGLTFHRSLASTVWQNPLRETPRGDVRSYCSRLFDKGVISSRLPDEVERVFGDVTSYEELHQRSVQQVRCCWFWILISVFLMTPWNHQFTNIEYTVRNTN